MQVPQNGGGKGPAVSRKDLIERGLLTAGLPELLGLSPAPLTPLYTWTQTEDELVLYLRVPNGGVRGRDFAVDFQATKLCVTYRYRKSHQLVLAAVNFCFHHVFRPCAAYLADMSACVATGQARRGQTL